MSKDYFKIPHNKHMGKKPKDWVVPKCSIEKILKDLLNDNDESRKKEVIINNNR